MAWEEIPGSYNRTGARIIEDLKNEYDTAVRELARAKGPLDDQYYGGRKEVLEDILNVLGWKVKE